MTEPAAASPAATAPSSEPAPSASWMRRLERDRRAPGLDTDAEPGVAPSAWGTVILLVLALLWLAGILRSAGAAMADNDGDAGIAISSAALALHGILTAVLLAGAAAALAVTVRFGGRTSVRRASIGAAGGAVIGLASGALVLIMFGANATIVAVAVTIAAAAILGGAGAAVPERPVVSAGIIATLCVYVFSTVVTYFQAPLKGALGAGATAASQFGAASRLALLTALLGGLIAGLLAYLALRRSPGADGRPWPWYLLAGATPGLIALAAEALTRLGGSGLLGIVRGFSPADTIVLTYLGGERIRSALIITFVGGIVAMIALGRTLRTPRPD